MNNDIRDINPSEQVFSPVLAEPIVIPLRKKLTVKSILFQHALEAFAVLVTAISILSESADKQIALTLAKAVVAVGMIIAIIVEYRHIHKGHLAKFPAVEILAGLIFFLESLHRFLAGHLPISIAWLLVSLMTIATGFVKPSFNKFRRIVLDNKGIYIRSSLFQKYRIEWQNIKQIIYSKSQIRIINNNSQWKLKLDSLFHSQQVLEGFIDGIKKMGVPSEMTEEISDKDTV
jgi:hypothetical protein